ncbi:hypothetical protein F511_35731 [Dorcoceras hygrometricum]|uniref:Uncharacterized protein n=1 Tax=Dorcoceras hygrometricum TaxID=472368 RepID=A0A2Z7BBU9_9LAMI|nr:hypothetical protein F511_35731 [Dorcoceras hygrometricum]
MRRPMRQRLHHDARPPCSGHPGWSPTGWTTQGLAGPNLPSPGPNRGRTSESDARERSAPSRPRDAPPSTPTRNLAQPGHSSRLFLTPGHIHSSLVMSHDSMNLPQTEQHNIKPKT